MSPPSPAEIASGGVGNCLACHQGPQFTDFLAHNIGTAQDEYDTVHGNGAFGLLAVPDLAARSMNEDLYLPASAAHPMRQGVFRRVPDASQPSWTDLGLWSVFANDDLPAPQPALLEVICGVHQLAPASCTTAQALDLSLGMFKTPGLRSLGQSAPYFHTGTKDDLDAVIAHYVTFSTSARDGGVRNADPRLRDIALVPADTGPLVAFLRSLNEDYQ